MRPDPPRPARAPRWVGGASAAGRARSSRRPERSQHADGHDHRFAERGRRRAISRRCPEPLVAPRSTLGRSFEQGACPRGCLARLGPARCDVAAPCSEAAARRSGVRGRDRSRARGMQRGVPARSGSRQRRLVERSRGARRARRSCSADILRDQGAWQRSCDASIRRARSASMAGSWGSVRRSFARRRILVTRGESQRECIVRQRGDDASSNNTGTRARSAIRGRGTGAAARR